MRGGMKNDGKMCRNLGERQSMKGVGRSPPRGKKETTA